MATIPFAVMVPEDNGFEADSSWEILRNVGTVDILIPCAGVTT